MSKTFSPNTLRGKFIELWQTQAGANVIFVVHGIDITAHSFVVSIRSPVLKTMVTGSMAPKDNRHIINDPAITSDDFHDFLYYLYHDRLPEVTKDNVDTFLHLGHMYEVALLIEYCTRAIKERFTGINIFRYAEKALLYEDMSKTLIQDCITAAPTFLLQNDMKYRNSENDKDIWISEQLALRLVKDVKRNEGRFCEEVLFQRILKWAHEKCRSNKVVPSNSNVKNLLEPLCDFIDFYKLDFHTLATYVYELRLISDEILLTVFRSKHMAAAIGRPSDQPITS